SRVPAPAFATAQLVARLVRDGLAPAPRPFPAAPAS
ncbi:MAG: hypothetical protein QOH43_2160, partial [Solirubrobacteraceae bacterium]|nr:hypothetical protein [Solirubrobacteraceae bacterium]